MGAWESDVHVLEPSSRSRPKNECQATQNIRDGKGATNQSETRIGWGCSLNIMKRFTLNAFIKLIFHLFDQQF